MYVGRFLVVTPEVAAYRVSSRSFPNRMIIEREDALAVVPTEDAPPTDNPYVSYHCLRASDAGATIGNGAHVDPIAEKLALGYPPRDALAESLLALDYEKDAYDTPRIAAVLGESVMVGIVRRDGLHVKEVSEPTILATYEIDDPTPIEVNWDSASRAVVEAYTLEYEHPVCAAAVERTADGYETATYNGPEGP